MKIFPLVYNLVFIPFYRLIIFIIKPFNSKLQLRQKNWKPILFQSLTKVDESILQNKKRVWFHASSMGEFEQAKPVIELLKKNDPSIFIIVSFYSPSGYENQNKYTYADVIVYMPIDTRQNAEYFIKSIQPDVAIFIRYDTWLNHLTSLKNSRIPCYLICATISGSKALLCILFYRKFLKYIYNLFSGIYTVGRVHTEFFQSLNLTTSILTLSDTRFDRIMEKVVSAKEQSVLPNGIFNKEEFVVIAGSCWQPDEEVILKGIDIFNNNSKKIIKVIFVPHEPTPDHILALQNKVPDSILLSSLQKELSAGISLDNIKKLIAGKHIIVDSIGLLLKLYANADAALIGGGYGVGVHSTTEAAGYGIPVATGPRFENSPDAVNLHRLNALFVIKNGDDFAIWLNKLINIENYKEETGRIAGDYVKQSLGSSDVIRDLIIKKLTEIKKG